MRMTAFAKRCAKEILRDPLTLLFGLGFPIVLLILLSVIQSNVPVELFEITSLAPGICVFGLSFMTLFSATLVAKDRESALLMRLYTTPLRPSDFILGYMTPIIPIAAVQGAVCYVVAVCIGLPVTMNIVYSILMIIPVSVFYVSLGLLCGSVFGVKQVGGICGGLFTNLSAWLSGIWFDLDLVGGAFSKFAKLLPFYHAVELQRGVIRGDFGVLTSHLPTVVIYAVITTVLAVIMFLRQMKRQ